MFTRVVSGNISILSQRFATSSRIISQPDQLYRGVQYWQVKSLPAVWLRGTDGRWWKRDSVPSFFFLLFFFWKIFSIREIMQAIRLSGDAASYAFFFSDASIKQNICQTKKCAACCALVGWARTGLQAYWFWPCRPFWEMDVIHSFIIKRDLLLLPGHHLAKWWSSGQWRALCGQSQSVLWCIYCSTNQNAADSRPLKVSRPEDSRFSAIVHWN